MAPHVNLEFSLFFLRRMKWLHYRLLCRCHSSSTEASPSSVHCLCFVMPEDAKMVLTSFFCSCVNIFRKTAAFLELWKQHPPQPSPSSSLPNVFLRLHRQMKPNEACCVLGAKSISTVDGAHGGIMSWLPETTGNADWSGAALNIIIITLKDLHRQRDGSQ